MEMEPAETNGFDHLIAALNGWLHASRTQMRRAGDGIELVIELAEATQLAAEATARQRTPRDGCVACDLRTLLDQIRSASITARFELVAAMDRQRTTGGPICGGEGQCAR